MSLCGSHSTFFEGQITGILHPSTDVLLQAKMSP